MAEERIGSRRPTRLSTAGNSMLSARISARFSCSSATPLALVRRGMDMYVSGLSALTLAGIVVSHAYATTNGMTLEGFPQFTLNPLREVYGTAGSTLRLWHYVRSMAAGAS